MVGERLVGEYESLVGGPIGERILAKDLAVGESVAREMRASKTLFGWHESVRMRVRKWSQGEVYLELTISSCKAKDKAPRRRAH